MDASVHQETTGRGWRRAAAVWALALAVGAAQAQEVNRPAPTRGTPAAEPAAAAPVLVVAPPADGARARATGPGWLKVFRADEVQARFQAGQERVAVIVNLAPPARARQPTDWNSAQSRATLHAANRGAVEDVLRTLAAGEHKVRHRFDNQPGFSCEVTEAGLEKLLAHPEVESVEPVFELQAHLAQGIPLMNALASRSTYTGAGMSIAICDTGIDYNHARLGGGGFPNSKVIGGYDFGDSDANPIPNGQAHGTACAGIAAGDLGTVGDYIGGVAPAAKLYACKISGTDTGSASSDAMIAAWDWCVTHQYDDPDNPILVISTSFGGGRYFSACDSASPGMTAAANAAVAAGITVLASSGNDGYCDSMGWPACISSVISVGAAYDANFGTYLPCVNSASCAPKTATAGCTTGYYATDATQPDRVTSYSNVASFLDVFGPANRCYTLDIAGSTGYSSGDYTETFGGTSAACPYAAGAVACLQHAAKLLTGSYLTPAEVRTRLATHGNNLTDPKVAITKPRVNLGTMIAALEVALVVTPVSGLSASGEVGGPFSPSSAVYVLSNTTAGALSWSASKSQAWLSLSASSGTLGAGASTSVTVSINGTANGLGAGSYADTVVITNLTSASGSTARPVSLGVTLPIVTVLLADFEDGSGGYGADGFTYGADPDATSNLWHGSTRRADSPTHSQYYGSETDGTYYLPGKRTAGNLVSPAISLAGLGAPVTLSCRYWLQTENVAGYDVASVEITTNAGASWITLATLSDVAAFTTWSWNISAYTGRTVQVRFNFDTIDNQANGFEGWYVDDVQVTGGIAGPLLGVSPVAGLSAGGVVGGPFSPASGVYALTNSGAASLDWSASCASNWVSLTPSAGTLAAGAGTNVTVSITTSANSLAAGSYADTVTFTNLTNGAGSTNRPVTLTVSPPPAQLAVTPAARRFSAVAVGQSPALDFQVANTGGQPLSGTATLQAGGSPFTVTGGGSFSVPAGQTGIVTVAFAPSAAGAFTNQVVFASNGGASTNQVTGTGMASGTAGETLLVAAGGLWKYRDNGTDQGSAWRAPAFDDGAWADGPAPLGYGDAWIVTTNTYGPDPNNKYVTTYYRRSFTVSDPAAFAALRLRLNRDDGAVVYINGTEVRRDLIAAGPVTYTTLANGTVSGADESAFFETTVPATALVAGTNTIAVELHQVTVTSSDLSFDLQVAGATAGLRKGPYLIYGNTNTQIQVLWQTDATPAQSTYIEWGPTPAYGNNSGPLTQTGSGTDEHQFSCILTGLTPGALCYYRVVVDSGSRTGSVVAAPPVDTASVTFYGFGDTRTYPDRLNAVAGAMRRDMDSNPGQRNTVALQVGDWVEFGGTESSWQNEYFNRGYTNSLDLLSRAATMGCRGNHDDDGGTWALMAKYWPYNGAAGYYSFDYGPVHVTVIDQYVGYTSGTAQYTWLTNDLASTTRPFKVAVFHEPAYSAGGGHANNATAQAVFDPLFAQYGVQIALVGHNHYYAHCLKDGTHHVTSGGGGAPLHTPDLGSAYLVAAESAYQYVRFDVSNTVMTVTAVRTNDTVIESFPVYQIPAAHFVASPTNGFAPLTVTFTDLSTGAITNRHWDFGDGLSTNTATTGIGHLYAVPGTYTVQLVASGPSGSSTNTQGALVVVGPVDTVGDGIPDWWRALYFGGSGQTTNAASCATCDADADERDNEHEYTADTDPTNRGSYLAIISIQPVANDVQITWVGGSNAWQYLAWSPDIAAPAGAWTVFHTNAPPTAITNVLTHTGAAAATNLFYRLNAQRPGGP